MTFELNKSYDFNFKTELITILGDKLKNMKVIGIMNDQQAVKVSDVATLHTQVLPLLSSLPINISDLTFIMFETLDKETVVYPIEYIEQISITQVTTINLRIDINNASTTDLSLLQQTLNELGYVDYSITQK